MKTGEIVDIHIHYQSVNTITRKLQTYIPKDQSKKQKGECFSHFSLFEKYFEINKQPKKNIFLLLIAGSKPKTLKDTYAPKQFLLNLK